MMTKGSRFQLTDQRSHHHDPEGHVHGHHDQVRPVDTVNRIALSATVHCLTGCGIGETIGLVIGTSLHWSNTPSIALATVLAFLFGYGLSLRLLLHAGMGLGAAAKVAFAADTISISVMELVDNTIMLVIPGAMEATPGQPWFWVTLLVSLGGAFIAVYPVNRWLIVRGRGHAVLHQYHH
jgi:hypothetical protein